jgi:hypothetical protein
LPRCHPSGEVCAQNRATGGVADLAFAIASTTGDSERAAIARAYASRRETSSPASLTPL